MSSIDFLSADHQELRLRARERFAALTDRKSSTEGADAPAVSDFDDTDEDFLDK